MSAQHHRVIKITIRCEECRNLFDHYSTRPEVSKAHKKLCDACERRRAYVSKDRCTKNKRKEVPIVDKAIEAQKPKKFLQRASIALWDPTLSLRENSTNLKISVSYAYRYASVWGLKYKYDFLDKVGQRAVDRPIMDHDSDAPSLQKFAWDNIPENLLGNNGDKPGEQADQKFSWDESCYLI